jgi:excinuclease ABC subunit C
MSKLDRIELFDNSNLFGTNCVSAMVVFINGKKEKSEYRKYKVSFDKNDDYGAMREVIYRRYFRVLKDNLVRPDLVIVDGSIGQIRIAKEIIDSLNLNIRVVGLRKNNRHATEALVDLENIYPIDKHSDLFNYLETMQNEVHNFAISYHKNLRSKSALSSVLDNISGIGDKRKKELIKKFKTVNGIRDAKIEELEKIVPSSVALALHEALKNYDNN